MHHLVHEKLLRNSISHVKTKGAQGAWNNPYKKRNNKF